MYQTLKMASTSMTLFAHEILRIDDKFIFNTDPFPYFPLGSYFITSKINETLLTI